MSKLHAQSNNDNIFVPEEGQRGFACSNKESFRCPSLGIKNKKLEEIRPVLKNLISRIIEAELTNYINNLYEKS